MKTRTDWLSAAAAALLLLSGCAHRSPAVLGGDRTPAPIHGAQQGVGDGISAPRVPQIVAGTGRMVSVPAPVSTPPPAGGNGFQLHFVDADIATIVATVLGDGLNLPYIVEPQVKGTMTLQATRPLSHQEVFAALEAALRVQGFALVEVDGVYHVVPAKDAVRRVAGLRVPGQGSEGFGIYVVPLQFVSADEMEKVLQPFAPEGGILRADESRNLLLLAGTSQEIGTLLNVVSTFDVDWLAGMSFGLFPLEYVDAKTLAVELTQIFTGEHNPIGGVVRFVPLTRLNSLMVVTPQQKYLQDVESWIRRLDVGATTPGRRIYVYDVQNAKADDLARSLNRILSLSGESSYDSGTSDIASNAGSSFDTSRSSSSLFGGAGSLGGGSLGSGGTFGSLGGVRSGLGGSTPAFTPAAPAALPAAAPRAALPATRDEGSLLQSGSLKIVPNSENNSLLILASPSEFSVVESALKRLDTVPIQVLIEASIAEVTLTDQMQYGLQWSYQTGSGPVVLSELASGAISQQFPGFSYLYTGRSDIRGVLNAIQSITNVRVLSSPKLMVLNNREAQLEVGDEVPITVQSAVSTLEPNAPIVNSVQFRDTGVILHVTPRANKSGRVTLEVAQEVSDVAKTTSSGIDSPTIEQRKLSSVVTVQDGETIALGGLIRDSRTTGGDGIPFLRKIPVLGHLFGSTNNDSTRTELIVLLTPHVIRSQQEAYQAMDELREEFRGLRRVLPVLKPGTEGHAAPEEPPESLQRPPDQGRGNAASAAGK